ncbi:MAG: hypothetical protein M0Q48_02825 [Verrucomicrobia bacterium]|jgi:hypothetical protein|nr:hypothetical protein [Verrucomicrobiota bacterium]
MNAPKNRYLFEYEHGSCKRVCQSKAGKVPQSNGVHKIAGGVALEGIEFEAAEGANGVGGEPTAGFGIVPAGAEKLDFKIKLPQRT